MTLQELETQLLSLTLSEKATDIQLLSRSLDENWRGIIKTPNVCGGDACIEKTRIPVWVLVQAYHLSIPEAQLLQDYPTLTARDLANAWVYAQVYPEEIAAAIHDNETA